MSVHALRRSVLSLAAGAVALPAVAQAAPAAAPIDTGDTAWMLVSTAFVLMMTIPGLALFYGGMVRKKNVLATLIQSFMICCIGSLVWMVAGYSLAFSTGSPWIGDLSRVLLRGVADNFHEGIDSAFTLGAGTPAAVPMTIPESVYMMFQMTFAVITPALITGAYAERMKFSSMCLFTVAWLLLVYAPVAHWVWSPTGWVAGLGAVDFAGGTVVHINSGVAGLVCAIILGRRKGIGTEDLSPFNLTYAIIGASLLWVGWFGFNAGSALGANGRAGMAMLTTQVAAAAGGVAWMVVEWMRTGKPTALGIISGAVAGLVAITPAAGFVLPGSAVLIGLIAGAGCFWSATWLKHRFNYDDSLDAFGVHGTGGIIGAILTGAFAYGPLSATASNPEGTVASVHQVVAQAEAVGVTVVWCVIMTTLILKVLDLVMGLRVSPEEELEGLDMILHGERIN
ncbi:ammonium transporter [Gluconobacter sphaericus]|uniref:Ammonium transporter n=1 Tax=Gluconobacter sphaericus NBRC 12467 TaxID=1307951 RepID=A0AA37W9P1_9PROT|nr:ammonium transporter [Gluconobacter sphaericus]GBR50793.1 ammonium transporter [Gluconobacter sphaericus NBRC 12467]GEB41784.1 ammonium transporter [Gluconobacter sphaericus NBRC 12467]GLQ84260.1 ammonium transporter [Gluconobacter sphaericus NBRC 12467]